MSRPSRFARLCSRLAVKTLGLIRRKAIKSTQKNQRPKLLTRARETLATILRMTGPSKKSNHESMDTSEISQTQTRPAQQPEGGTMEIPELDRIPSKPAQQGHCAQHEFDDSGLIEAKPSKSIPFPGTQVVNHRREFRSIAYSQYKRCQKDIQKRDRDHELAMATEPVNPILESTGQPRHLYETYQAKVATRTLVDETKVVHTLKSLMWETAARLRLEKAQGLREWEWPFGEPEDCPYNGEVAILNGKNKEADIHAIEVLSVSNPKSVEDVENGDRVTPKPQKSISYAERVKGFTYNREDDPMWKGKYYYMQRSNDRNIFLKSGNFSDEMSKEDQEYVPKADDGVDILKEPRSFRHEHDNKDQEEQMAFTAKEYLFNGVSRTEAKQMEADTKSQPTVVGNLEVHSEEQAVPEVGASQNEVQGEGMQRFARCRMSSASGCSVMSGASEDDDDDD